MTRVFHLAHPADPSKPLCTRVLSRNAELTVRDHHSMQVGHHDAPGGFALGQEARRTKPCRHCLRADGLLPPLSRASRDTDTDFDGDSE